MDLSIKELYRQNGKRRYPSYLSMVSSLSLTIGTRRYWTRMHNGWGIRTWCSIACSGTRNSSEADREAYESACSVCLHRIPPLRQSSSHRCHIIAHHKYTIAFMDTYILCSQSPFHSPDVCICIRNTVDPDVWPALATRFVQEFEQTCRDSTIDYRLWHDPPAKRFFGWWDTRISGCIRMFGTPGSSHFPPQSHIYLQSSPLVQHE